MKNAKKTLVLALLLVMLVSLCAPIRAEAKGYSDVAKDAWYYEYVNQVTSAGIMLGTDETRFSPNLSLNRAMMATVLYRLEGSPTGYVNSFSDVAKGTYYYDAVSWAQSVHLINGVGSNRFAPKSTLTRQDMATMLYRYAEYRHMVGSAAYDLGMYPDGDKVSNYARDAVSWILSVDGLHCEGGQIQPRKDALRADVAAGLALFLNDSPQSFSDIRASAFEIALKHGFVGSESEWLDSLKGEPGQDGQNVFQLAVANGYEGTEIEWLQSLIGPAGRSAYELAVDHGFSGSEEQWLASLVGKAGTDGRNAFQLAVANGYKGTEIEWLQSLIGKEGRSAYELAVDHGFSGSEEQWLASLVGKAGTDGVGISNAYINGQIHLILLLTDGTEIDAGYVGVPVVSAEERYTVTFIDYDGSVLKTEQVKAGENAEPPAEPVREGYVFSGWLGAYSDIRSDVSITATYTQITGPAIAVNVAGINADEKTVSVTVSLVDNPGISSLKLLIGYDDRLTLTGVSCNTSVFGSYVTAPEPYGNPQAVSLMSPLADIEASGVYATLTFSVEDGVAPGTRLPVTVSCDPDNTFNAAFEAVSFQTFNGAVIINE